MRMRNILLGYRAYPCVYVMPHEINHSSIACVCMWLFVFVSLVDFCMKININAAVDSFKIMNGQCEAYS